MSVLLAWAFGLFAAGHLVRALVTSKSESRRISFGISAIAGVSALVFAALSFGLNTFL